MKMLIIESDRAKAPARPPIALVPRHRTGETALSELDTLNPARRFLNTLSPSSRRSMRANLERVARLLRVPLEAVPWHMLRAPHLEALRAAMQELRPKGSKSPAARLAPATINATLAALRGVARQAYLLGALDPDEYRQIGEVSNVRGARVSASARALEMREVASLLAACDEDETAAGERDGCLIALMAGAGLRRAEAAALDLADWRTRTHTLRVKGKGNKERLVYLEDGGTRRRLADWLKLRGAEPGALLVPVDPKGRLVMRHMTGQAVYNAVLKRRRQAGVRRVFSPHALRHFFADRLMELGAGIEAVSDLLGHASVATTEIYYHGGERAKRKASRLIKLPYSGGGRRRRRRKHRRGRK